VSVFCLDRSVWLLVIVFSMKRNLLTAIALIALCMTTLTVAVHSGRAQRNEFESPRLPEVSVVKPLVLPKQPLPKPTHPLPVVQMPTVQPVPTVQPLPPVQPLPTDCAIQPEVKPTKTRKLNRAATAFANNQVTLERFRRSQPLTNAPAVKQRQAPTYKPREEIILIHPTNYGDRFLRDVHGRLVNQPPIVVLHETVASASSTINFFRTAHPRDEDQASYHTLIRRDGTVVYLVPPDKRAFGAGNSVFNGAQGAEAVKTHPRFPPSVNNFAYHISLETPGDGINNSPRHSGYTEAQYQSLAWVVAKTAVADDRITTHKAVDRSESRMDPRSFRFSRFFQLLQTHTKTDEIPLRCTIPPEFQAQQRLKPAQQRQLVKAQPASKAK